MRFNRFEQLIGTKNFEKVKNLSILVIGVGGVGGYVVEALVRCGIENITVVDFDIVDETNINRQIIATTSALGRKKVEVVKERVQDISNACKCNAIDNKIAAGAIESIIWLQEELKITFDFVVDACDDLFAKKTIIKECTKRHIEFISCMGTGRRLDPRKLEITTLDKTSYDPIAKILRKYVRDEHIKEKIVVLASKEQPIKTEPNIQTIASCSFVPASAGLLIASYIVKKTIHEE